MHLYLNGGTIDVPGGVYSDLVNYWYSFPPFTGGRSKSELRTIAEMLLPVYIYGVAFDNVPEVDLVSGGGGWLASANRELTTYMQDRSGIAGSTIVDFLMILHDAVQEGIVPAQFMEPATWEDVKPPTLTEKLDPFGQIVTAGMSEAFTKTLVTAGIVVGVVILGKAVINKVI